MDISSIAELGDYFVQNKAAYALTSIAIIESTYYVFKLLHAYFYWDNSHLTEKEKREDKIFKLLPLPIDFIYTCASSIRNRRLIEKEKFQKSTEIGDLV